MVDLDGYVVVLDLDDTLYPERSFALSGFAAVGEWVAAEHGIADFGERCRALFLQGVRGSVFDRALAELDGAGERAGSGREISVADLVAVYREHRPRIALCDDARDLLPRLDRRATALITDGPVVTQANKVAALELDRWIGKVVLTGALPPGCGKPHPMPFELVETWSRRAPREHVYIADNAAKDFLAPRARGWLTIQIRRPGRIHAGDAPTPEHAAVLEIASLGELVPPRPRRAARSG